MDEKMKIFVVEDDDAIAAAIQKLLESWGYAVKRACDYSRVFDEFDAYKPHLVLLDVMLPQYNGYHWCQKIRETSSVPIVFVTSLSDNMNAVMAMNLGGDDFIAKPFDKEVLMAKLRAILRRSYDFAPTGSVISIKGASLNMSDATLRAGNEKIELTRNEYRIMQVLMENEGVIVSRDTLIERLWQTDSYIDENALAVNITRLRKKLAAVGLPDFIKTKRGIGYIVEK